MISIVIPHNHHKAVLKYVQKHVGFTNGVNTYSMCIDNDYSCVFLPYFGTYQFQFDDISVTVTCNEEGKPMNTMEGIQYFTRLTLSVEDAHYDHIQDFISKAIVDEKRTDDEQKIRLYTSSYRGYFNNMGAIYAQDWDKIYVPPKIKTDIVKGIEKFFASKQRYISYGRLFKLCFLLTGPPGSGKTSMVKAIALKYKRPVYVLSFTKQLTDETFIELMSELKEDSILLIEDIDAFFVDRTVVDINISFSAFINFLDGILGKGNGVITFITANNPDRLDKAIIRPGRIDRIVKFDYPKKREVHAAFMDMITDATPEAFGTFYSHISDYRSSMSGIVDHLFRYPTVEECMENIDELLEQTKLVNEISSEKTDKLYH